MLRMNSSGPVLVTGANGFVGSHLIDHLLARGDRVRALVRSSRAADTLPAGVEVAFGDVTRPTTLPAAVHDTRIVYHAAGVVATFREATYHEVNARGTRNLLLAVAKANPTLSRFLLVSSLAAAGPCRGGRRVKETDRPRPVSIYGRSKLAGEQEALRFAGELPVTIVRPPIVYGPRDRDVLELFLLVHRGFRLRFAREKYFSIVHAADLARGIRSAAESPAAAGRTYHLADRRAWSLTGILLGIADALRVDRVRAVPVSEGLAALLGCPADQLARGLSLPLRPFRDKAHELRPDAWVADVSRADAELGFATEIPLAEGLRETAGFYLANGWIPGPVRTI